MALGTPTSLGTTAQASASASTQAHQTTGAAPADSTVVVCLGHSSAGNPLTPTITDDQGGVYTVALLLHGGSSMTTAIAYRHCPAGLISGAIITASWGATQTAARFTHVSYMTGNGKPERTASNDRSGSAFNTYICGVTAATLNAGQAIGVMNSANGVTPNNTTGSSPAATVHVATSVSSKGFGVIRSAPGAGVTVTQTGQVIPLVTSATLGVLVHFVGVPAQATETDTAGAIGVYRHGIGQAVETDTAGRITPLAVSPGDLGPLTAVGSSSATAAGTTQTYTLDSDIPANSTIVLAGATGAGGAPFKVSDNSGLLRWWTARRAEQTGGSPCGVQIAFAYARQRIPAGTVITITTGSVNTARYIAVSYFSGQGVPDRSAGATGTGTAWSTGATPATGSFRELVVTAAHLLDSGTTTDTSSPGQDVVQNILGSASRRLVVRSTRGVLPATAVTGSGVWSISGTWAAATVTFRAVSPGEPRYPAKRTSLSPDHTWLLDDPSGTVADDSVGVADGTYVNTPTLANAGMIEDSTASVATTAAQSEDITLPISLGNSFTFEAWIEDLALATAALRDNTSSNGTILALLASAIISIRIGGTTVSTGVSERALRGKHHHVFTKSGTTVVWYVDGQPVFTGSSFPSSHSSTSPFHLSRNGTVANFETAGWDDVSTYPAALTADEVRDLFAAAVSYRYPVNRATETDTAGSIVPAKVLPAIETDTARALTVGGVDVGRASETDSAGTITRPAGRASIRSVSAISSGTPFNTTFAVDAPDSIVVGDLLVAIFVHRHTIAKTGWFSQFDIGPTAFNSNFRMEVFTRTADAGDAAASSFTWTASGASNSDYKCVILAVKDCNTSAIYQLSTNVGDNISAQIPSITSAHDGIYIGAWGEDLNFSQAVPGTMTLLASGLSSPDLLVGSHNIDTGEVYAPTASGGNIFGTEAGFIIANASASQTVAVGQATETDSAGAIAHARGATVAAATETDTASRFATPINRATETDTPGRLAKPVRVSQASETDTAGAVRDAYAVGRATETDTARPITAIWFPLVDQATETDTAGTVVRLLVDRATELDTAGTVIRLLVYQATETDTASATPPTLQLHPEFIDVDGGLYSVVFDPTLALTQTLEPEPFAPPAATVYNPTLSHAQSIEPDTFTGLSPTVFDPAIVLGQFLEVGDLIVNPEPTVFSPAIVLGQFLYPDVLTGGLSPTVFDPALVPGQAITPVLLDPALSVTVYDPALAHGQPIAPDVLINPEPIVFDPALAPTQVLVVGDLIINPEPTVFNPALAQREPSVITAGGVGHVVRAVVRGSR